MSVPQVFQALMHRQSIAQAAAVTIDLAALGLRPAQFFQSVYITAGVATGACLVVPTGGFAADPGVGVVGVAVLSADGNTLTFASNVTNVILMYAPQYPSPPVN